MASMLARRTLNTLRARRHLVLSGQALHGSHLSRLESSCGMSYGSKKVICGMSRASYSVREMNASDVADQFRNNKHAAARENLSVKGVGLDAQVETDLSVSLAGVVGKAYTFQLKLTDFNFSSKHQTFTISRIFLERALAPIPTFAIHEGGKVAEEAHPGVVPQETDGQFGNPGAGANKPSPSATTSDKRPQQAKDDADVDDNGRKKAHVG